MSWSLECTVQVKAETVKVWEFWSNVENWKYDSGIRDIRINGPFQSGAQGVTYARDGYPWKWALRNVIPGKFASIAMKLNGAYLIFNWTFESLGDNLSQISQKLELEGENAAEFESIADNLFSQNLKPGMLKLADQITKYADSATSAYID